MSSSPTSSSSTEGVELEPLLLRFGTMRMEVSFELGRTPLSVRDLLDLKEGSLVMLARPAGDDLEVRVNSEPFGRGEVVEVDSRAAVRLLDFSDEG